LWGCRREFGFLGMLGRGKLRKRIEEKKVAEGGLHGIGSFLNAYYGGWGLKRRGGKKD